ncbi:MAG: hypothetical protein ACE5HX_06540 [bacterium]
MFEYRFNLIILLTLSFLFVSQKGFAQMDRSQVNSDTTNIKVKQEMVLDEIVIEAVIEKPNVAILPTRQVSEFDDIQFINRSFEKELQAAPEKLLLIDINAEVKKNIDKLKKILTHKKKSG